LRTLDVKLWVEGDRLRYNAPPGILTPNLRTELIQRKEEILEFLREVDAAMRFTRPPILPIARDKPLPLSFAQQRLWFLHQLQPDSVAYNVPIAIRLTGSLQIAALKQSLSEIARRHEILRTTFTMIDGRPIQVVHEWIDSHQPWQIDITDLQERPAARREAEMQRLATQATRNSFDLEQGPLFSANLWQLNQTEHLLLLTIHHLVFDGWSVGVFYNELASLYQAFTVGSASPLPELPIQYGDFAVWQRAWLQGEALATQVAYWKQQLKDMLPALQLPTDRPRPAIQTFQGSCYSFVIPRPLTEMLKLLGQQEEVTLFMILLATFKLLLYRYTGQTDVVVGSPIANRNRSELENLIGFFVNTLILRTNLAGNPSFQELLKRVREMSLGAYAHQDLPFEQLVETLQPERDLSQQPLFQVMFVLQNTSLEKLELPGLTLSPVLIESGTSKFDLSLILEESLDGLTGILEYNTDLFDPNTITRMMAHFQNLLKHIVINPAQKLLDIPMLVEGEEELLRSWNDTQTSYPDPNRWIHQLFEAQVEQTPQAIALVYEDKSLSYHQLNQRANQLAHYLQAHGVGPEIRVGVCMERSLEMVIALYGILKAGGAYLPLDPTYPQERLTFMLQNAQATLLLTQRHLLPLLPVQPIPIICLDANWDVMADQATHNPDSGVGGDNLAYVIYTSGSTGQPKGVMNTHQAIRNRLLWMQDAYRLTQTDRVLQKTPFSFDVSVWEFFWPLLAGARLILARPEGHKDSAYLVKLIAQQKVTSLHFVPSMLQAFIQEPNLEQCDQLRRVICSGEALPFDLQERFFARFPQPVELHNLYGPTEAAIDVTAWVCQRHSKCRLVPIGRPIANIQIYILDSQFQPTPIGVPGELYIGGAGLARGYQQRPDLTAESFIPNPFSREPGSRLYRTGDLARYLPDGNIEYIGRLDYQVKVRGFRIELGEIEAALLEHPLVQEVIVIARDQGRVSGSKSLVAYIIPDKKDQTEDLLVSDLRHFLQTKLPDYMIPAIFVLLKAFPLTPNGKVDRQALPEPDLPRSRSKMAAPRTRAEIQLASIWAELLGLDRVGIYDNFFELGGDSILSLQIIARANQAGLRLTPRQIFQHQTIAELAAATGKVQAIEAEQGPVTGSVPLTPIQRWFLGQQLSVPNHWNQAMLCEVASPLRADWLAQVIQCLVEHHDALRLRFIQTKMGWHQFNAALDKTVPFVEVDLSTLTPAAQSAAITAKSAELQASLNLAEGPLLYAALFQLGPEQSARLLIIAHHLVIDGVSWRILLDDLQGAYQQISQGAPIQLPPKTTSFKQWAETLSEYSASNLFEAESAYWLSDGWSRACPIKIDYPEGRKANTEGSVRIVSVSLGMEESRALLQDIHSVYQTQITDILLTALAQAFARWSRQPEGKELPLLIDLEGHGREKLIADLDLSRTIGWFTAIFPVLLELKGISQPGKAIISVKEQLRRIPNHGIGYGLLRYANLTTNETSVDTLQQQLKALPQADIAFNYMGQFDSILAGSSLFRLAGESTGPSRSPNGQRRYLVEIDGKIIAGQLQLDWFYSQNVFRRDSIEALANDYIEALRALIKHCQSPRVGGYTPSDFPEAGLSQAELDDLILELSEPPE
jgi:amino acid adenylation domain-containing protein/non-ribosomal peptide synthase protein (TIGR01720 family)